MNDLILNEMMKLLDEYDYNYTQTALEDIINEWERQKASLIEMFKRHPNYIEGKFLIAFDSNYERSIDLNAVNAFGGWLRRRMSMIDTPDNICVRKANPNHILPIDIVDYIYDLCKWCNQRTVDEEHAKKLNEILPEIHPHAGQKTSRVINQFCNYLGWSKLEDYNREFAKFADALSPLTIKRHTILSLNPLDYLTMSFGNSWASCHTIDKHNKRNMPNSYHGQYSSGTMSYMLDSTSMVFYTVDASYDGTDYWSQPKITRQMFHWGENMLVQSRLYPQNNDGNDEAYTPYRNIVQAIMAQVQDIPNLWTVKRGCLYSDVVHSVGTHYQDYLHYASTTLSRPKDSGDDGCLMTIGAVPICIECGHRHDKEDTINCCQPNMVCAKCGNEINDDVIYINGMPYCEDCVTWCDCCDCYELNENTIWVERDEIYICRDCRDNYYARCDVCGDWEHKDNMNWVESTEEWVCDYCLQENYTRCEQCDEYFPNEEIYFTDDGDYLCTDCYNARCEEEEEL